MIIKLKINISSTFYLLGKYLVNLCKELLTNTCMHNVLFVYISGDILKINRAYVFRLYPSVKQIELIEKSFGISRFIYNYFLGLNNHYMNKYYYIKQMPKLEQEHEWLKEVDSYLLRCSIFNLVVS